MKFEILINDQYVVLKNGISAIWWPRLPLLSDEIQSSTKVDKIIKPEFKIHDESDEKTFEDFTCYGLAYGLVGLFDSDKLILIKQAVSIGRLPFGSHDEVFKIQKICIISLVGKNDSIIDLGLDICVPESCTKPGILTPTNQSFVQASFKDSLIDESSIKLNTSAFTRNPPTLTSASVQRTWNQIKMTASNVKPKVSSMITNVNNTGVNKIEDKEKFDRRLIEEVQKMFNDTDSFYYSLTGDLTNSVQRQQKLKQNLDESNLNDIRIIPLWKRVDDRFFWNKYMLDSIMKIFENDNNEEQIKCYSHLWILPIIQGFIQIEKCCFDLNENSPVGIMNNNNNNVVRNIQTVGDNDNQDHDKKVVDSFLETQDYYWMALISRRSRFRAGTRYKKRGLDENGTCANYVETEQIFSYGFHTVSFVCVRGSVPLFWSQPGNKYRPPPLLERSEKENMEAFRKHFEQEFKIYDDNVVAINLIEQTGREKVLSDAYTYYSIKMDDSRLTYVTFDFHDYCRGMKFENVSILIERIYELIKEMRYCWIDNDGSICEQRGVFRINCVDCLDRTNIVMTAIAKAVMDIQLVRLGLLPPEGQLSANSRRVFQLMWARNGDIISRQYAGTAALKSDYTRTGERKISGVVRDGYNSANRYYLNRFKDAYRQAVIDIMQGNPVVDVLSSPINDKSPRKTSIANNLLLNNDQEYHERIKMVIEDCKKILVPEDEVILGGWPLVDADPVTGTPLSAVRITNEIPDCEMDIVLILTKDCYYVADYDDQTDRIIKYQKVLLEDLEKIEIGAEPIYPNGSFSSIRNQSCPIISYAVRFNYSIGSQPGYYHMFRSTHTRFFNNMAIPIRTREEALESLKAICESFKVALSVKSLNVPFLEVSRLERRKSKRILTSSFKSENQESFNRLKNVPNDNSYVVSSKKLFTGVYSHFSRLRGKLTGSGGSNGQQQNVSRQNIQIDGFKIRSSGNTTDMDPNRKFSDEIDFDESDEDDSLGKLATKKLATTKGNLLNSSVSADRSISSDLSDCSEFGSEQILPPISEICSPCLDDEPCLYTKENMDRVLESCGILVTSPPLRFMTPNNDDLNSANTTPKHQNGYPLINVDNNSRMKSVLHDVDDFVIDSMKKASLRQMLRKAVSQSQVFPSSSSNSEHEKMIKCKQDVNINKGNSINKAKTSPRQSSRCIFNSDLALNSIVSQPINMNVVSHKFNSSESLNNVTEGDIVDANRSNDGSGINSSYNLSTNKDDEIMTYPLISSSSFAALSYQNDENDFKSLGSESISARLYESYLDKNQDNPSIGITGSDYDNSLLSNFAKETSLSFSDLGFTKEQQSGLKTSRSSNTLQLSSGFTSLNLPPACSVTNISGDNESTSQSNQSGSNFSTSFGVKKDFVLSPLTRITKGLTQTLNPVSNLLDLQQQQQQQQRQKIINQQHQPTKTNIIEI